MKRKNRLIRTVAIVEPIITIILGVIFFFLFRDNLTIAAVTLVVGSYLSINGIILAIESTKRLDANDELAVKFQEKITPQLIAIDANSRIMDLYRKINDPDLTVYRDLLIENLLKNLVDLSQGTLSIEGDECLTWILKCFKSSQKEIHGVSALANQEWIKDERERRLYLENVNAKNRGVSVNRIFIANSNLLCNYIYRTSLLCHANDGLNAFVVFDVSINEDDALLKVAHHGFVLIDGEFGFVDDYFPGKTTGRIIKRKELCQPYYKYYSTLFYLSKPVKSVLLEHYAFQKEELARKYPNIANILDDPHLTDGSLDQSILNDYILWFEIMYYDKHGEFLDYFKVIGSSDIVASPRMVISALLRIMRKSRDDV